ncbi:MAG TPA: hypothetical protein VGG10_11260 [Rhizomicrobium sp.]|jgi:Ca2+-binding RTX toxin-like protein
MTVSTKILHGTDLGRAHWGDDDDTLSASNLNPYQDAVAIAQPEDGTPNQITNKAEIAALESYAPWNPGLQYHQGDIAEYQGALWQEAYGSLDMSPGTPNAGWSIDSSIENAPDAANYFPVVAEAPMGLKAGYTSDNAVTLFWNQAYVLGTGEVNAYNVYENGKLIGSTQGTSLTITGLTASKGYDFTVSATDMSGTSAQSQTLLAHTAAATTATGQFFSPFVDMTLPTTDILDLSRDSGLRDFTLAFTQSTDIDTTNGNLESGATPTVSWGGLANTVLPLGSMISEVHQVEAEGGAVTVSFGGYMGRDPAVIAEQYENQLVTQDHMKYADAQTAAVSNLAAEYQSVINTYGTTHLDFDIEQDYVGETDAQGNPVKDGNGNQILIPYENAKGQDVVQDIFANHLRDLAINAVEATNPNTTVTFTLATEPGGLSNDYMNVLKAAKADGVKIDVVNVMAMDYFDGDTNDMADNAILAANKVHAQLQSLGIDAKIEITPMIGQNDDYGPTDPSGDGVDEVFSLGDAIKLVTYAHQNASWVSGLGMWELPRDSASTTDTTGNAASSTSSSVVQSAFEYASILNQVNMPKATNGADTLTGNISDNALFGWGGNDTLKGGDGNDILDGGVGKDKLVGGPGADSFVFDTAIAATNVDTIVDFTHNVDHIVLDGKVFAGVGTSGAFNANDFVADANGTATNTSQHIIYNTHTGILYYDADGNGTAHAAVEFAVLTGAPTVSAADFALI